MKYILRYTLHAESDWLENTFDNVLDREVATIELLYPGKEPAEIMELGSWNQHAQSLEKGILLALLSNGKGPTVTWRNEEPKEGLSDPTSTYYRFYYKGIKIDPYRIFDVYSITNGAHQHALKKLLRAGKSIKSLEQDIDETIDSLRRWKEMIQEDKDC